MGQISRQLFIKQLMAEMKALKAEIVASASDNELSPGLREFEKLERVLHGMQESDAEQNTESEDEFNSCPTLLKHFKSADEQPAMRPKDDEAFRSYTDESEQPKKPPQ